jgi:hypothetical protein
MTSPVSPLLTARRDPRPSLESADHCPSTGAITALDNERLERIEQRVDEIHALLTRTAPFCEKMGEHISFVECVMQRMRFPAWLFAVRTNTGGNRALPDAALRTAGAGDT